MSLLIIDFDGKILFLDKECENIFGCKLSDVFKKKRIYNFLDPNYIIEFSKFLKITIEKREIKEIKTVLNIYKKILFKIKSYEKEFIIIEIKEFINKKEDFKNKVIDFGKINLIIRSKFIIGSMIPLVFSLVWTFYKYKNINFGLIPLLLISLFFLHAAANTFNDYFDWVSERDQKNLDYILFSTGGSRSLDFKLISEKKLLIVSLISLTIAFSIGIYFVYLKGFLILVIGFIAFFSVYFYSAPPIHLASRYGLGELMHIFCLGPLITLGSTIILTEKTADFCDFFSGLPFGFLITGCLLINECPDSISDKLNKKFNLPALLGIKYIPYIYLFLTVCAFISVFFGIFYMNFPKSFYFIIFVLPYLYKTLKHVFKIEENRNALSVACVKSFDLYIKFSFFIISSLLIQIILN